MAKIKTFRISEGKYPGEFLVSDANGNRSRGKVVVAGPAKFEPGTYLALGSIAGFVEAYDPATLGTGSEDVFAGIAWEGVDLQAGESQEIAAIQRDAVVSQFGISFAATEGTSTQKNQIKAKLLAAGIVVR